MIAELLYSNVISMYTKQRRSISEINCSSCTTCTNQIESGNLLLLILMHYTLIYLKNWKILNIQFFLNFLLILVRTVTNVFENSIQIFQKE